MLGRNVEKKRISTTITRLIENILLIAYCDNKHFFKINKKSWINNFYKYQNKSIDILKWGMKSPDNLLINWMESNLQESYEDAITIYKNKYAHCSYFRNSLRILPTECPWDLQILLRDEIDDLMIDIPNNSFIVF